MLTTGQIEQFRKDGYFVHHKFLSTEQLAVLISEIEEICGKNSLARHDKTRLEMEPNQPSKGTLVRRIYEPCTYSTLFRKFSESEEILGCVEQLLGPNLTFHYSKINMKPPKIGSIVEWHQDLTYYPLSNTDSLAILFYLDHTDEGNGCLHLLPGQHLQPPLDHTIGGFFRGRVTESLDLSRIVPVLGKAGTAVFIHGLTPHASATNTSNRPRRTLILSYRAADAFPIYLGETTVKQEKHARYVRGQRPTKARFGVTEFPIPQQEQATVSLYELQELSRKQTDDTKFVSSKRLRNRAVDS